MSKPANSKYVRITNRSNVLKVIHDEISISRIELAKVTGLTGAAITLITRELMQTGLIKEVGQGEADSARGRKPIALEMQAGVGYVLGIEITKQEALVGLTDLTGQPVLAEKLVIDFSIPEESVPILTDQLKAMITQLQDDGRTVMGIGISLPALLDPGSGIVKKAVNFSAAWENYALKKAVHAKLQLPVFVENNAKASVLAERTFGEGKPYKNLAYVNFGYGISAGIMMDDRIIHGAQGHAGEIGHVVMEEHGPVCNCGNHGCLEAICGLQALLKQAKHDLQVPAGQEITEEIFLHSALQEGSYAWLMMRTAGRYLGLAISYIISLYNPEAVFIGGKTALAAPAFMDILLKTVQCHVLPEVAAETKLAVSELNGRAAWTGACALAVQGLLTSLESPLYAEERS